MADFRRKYSVKSVQAPLEFEHLFAHAEKVVSTYFQNRKDDTEHGTIEILGERYILVRAASLSIELYRQIENLFGPSRELEINQVFRDVLFDLAHYMGKSDARDFHKRMNLVDPNEKISAGPVFFSHSGWAKVKISQDRWPMPNESYSLVYDHLFSFESDAWLRQGRMADFPVCIMNAGYSSGWCEESYGLPLVSSEVLCRAKGEEICRFIMAPPTRIQDCISKYFGRESKTKIDNIRYEIPDFFAMKRIEYDLFQANSFVNSIIEHIPNMIFVKSAEDLRFIRFNKAGEDLLGYSRDELIGKNDYDFFPKGEADIFISQDREVLRQGKVLDFPENMITTRNKGIRCLRSKKVPILDSHGNPQYLLGISEDITDKKYSEGVQLKLRQEQIARAEAEKNVRIRDDFISIASHELKTPLTSLRMQFQMIPKLLKDVTFPRSERFNDLFQKSLKQLDQFSKLVEDLLDLSRIDADRLQLDLKPVELYETILRVIEQYSGDLQAAGCELKLDIRSRVEGKWDPIRIEQVLVNLLTNAVKYGSGRPIEIQLQLKGDKVLLVVRDQGIGISLEDQAKIFQRFERVAPVTMYRGLGLGLFITRQIVQAHGGRIWVESEVGKGSSFFVELPK